MAVTWSPAAHARPSEWLLRVAESQPPYAVVRRFLLGNPNRADEWFRVVTWAPTSDTRELIGWVRTFEAACFLAWDHKCAYESWRHHLAAQRVDSTSMNQLKPPASDLVKFWRQHNRPAASRGSATQKEPRPTRR